MTEEVAPKEEISTSFMDDIISKSEEKSKYTILMELFKEQNLPFITEFPTVRHTLLAVKYQTWRVSLKEATGIDDNIVGQMLYYFMLYMPSHKRQRSKEIIQALQSEKMDTALMVEKRGLRRFFGGR